MVPGEHVADRPMPAFFVAEGVLVEQAFVLGIEPSQLLVLAWFHRASRSSRGEAGRSDAVSLELVDVLIEEVATRSDGRSRPGRPDGCSSAQTRRRGAMSVRPTSGVIPVAARAFVPGRGRRRRRT